jgi:hypothetical protein
MLSRPAPLDGVHPVTDWPRAQTHVNFVLVGPRAGSAWRITAPTLRGESPRHHSTVRFFLDDPAGRRLRVKQYYHDWWIPTVVDISFRTPGRPVAVGDAVAFVGRDYRRRDASCGHRWGTGVEFCLEAGAMGDGDWAALWSSLDALDPGVLAEARATPFAARSYWNRWGRTEAPWDTTEISSLAWSAPTSEAMERAAWALTPDRWAPVPGTVDSLGFRAGPQGEEVQMVFRRPVDLEASAWLRALRAPPEPWRPLLDASEVNRPRWSRVEIGGVTVERAHMDASVGNWFYAWREGDRAYELHLRARKGLDAVRADAVVAGLRS